MRISTIIGYIARPFVIANRKVCSIIEHISRPVKPFLRKKIFEPQTFIRDITLAKAIRIGLVAFMFYGSAQLMGMKSREAQQFIYMLGGIVLFSLLVKNIWITLFMTWTVFLFSLYKFTSGHPYVMNVFLGCILYYLTKVSVRQEHIRWYVKFFMLFIAINILYAIVQVLGYDWIYWLSDSNAPGGIVQNMDHPSGFMANDGIFGMLMAFGLPLLTIFNLWLAPILLIPICISTGSINFMAAGIAYIFILYFRINRALWVGIMIVLALASIPYFLFVDSPDWTRLDVWKLALQDTQLHPITGWGLDSFRRDNLPHKQYSYTMNTAYNKEKRQIDMAKWDNPHNLYISLLFEWGLVGVLIMIGYLCHLGTLFKKAIKYKETVALAGFVLVFLIVSIANFPIFLSRMAVFIIPLFAMYEISCQ